ncbi:hypothetical protein [Cryptosporidium parvum Iowa II]|uniref:Uncharacterized protein n=2 Tax=Cryptosporidium parvum TaxID=5807 RepID=Q5CTB6_CRYPI|nr:hypothetical protein [Cryptosporidium parvum Iowa II]EAK88654.1 hypothetical protein cgd2_3670 [Cryptosporidium parvum Iowa II]QOY42862.1 Uncharacterized protein CPATCC_0027130 [Cryptosporidium parvum]WKS76665.1 hypothetical protein CPCDC_2g3670 [Cryptosporidium sp. 43IA8]WRK31159.1 Uncharacterized protein cpbgf_2003670 [Cryptosporidium parvum]|eukprot:QOY42862.1 hypothetical protein CPATCC_000545 [Cryptosporidium parvum]
MNSEEYTDWYSLENLDNTKLNFDELKEESGWFNIEIDKNDDSDIAGFGASESLIWSLSIHFRSITLQDPATVIFKAPNWYKIIKSTNEISPSKCPKTSPPYPCRRSTTIFSDHEIEITSRIVCSWKDIFDRLNCEPLKIEAYKVSTFGDQELHSMGYVNLKHILIQTEKTNPTISGNYIFGSNTFRIWPTRILLYPASKSQVPNDHKNTSNELDSLSDSELEPNSGESKNKNSKNSVTEEEKSVPIGLIEVDIVLQDCKKQPISDGSSPGIRQKSLNTKTDQNSSLFSRPRSVSRSRSRSRPRSGSATNESPINERTRNNLRNRPKTPPSDKRVSFSPQRTSRNVKYEPGNDEEFISPEDLEFLKIGNMYDKLDSNIRSPGVISDFSSKIGYFTVGDVDFSNKLIETIIKEIDNDELYEQGLENSDDYTSKVNFEIWKRSEKERFVQHLHNLEEEFRKLTLIRQETIMKDFIGDISRKSNKLGRLENLVSNKILKLKNKENSIDNINDENNRKMKLFQFEQTKLLESQKNEFKMKLELEKKKTQIAEFEKNKWFKKYSEEEEINEKLHKEIQSLKTGRKSDLYFKNELLRKDELIQSFEDQILQLKESVQILRASRDHYKTQFEHLAAAVHLFPEKETHPTSNKSNNVYTHNIESLVQSGLYNEDDQFIQLLKSNNNIHGSFSNEDTNNTSVLE